MHLSLWGRDCGRLADIAGICRASGASVATRSLDIQDVAAAVAAATAENTADPFDLALLVSGLGDIRVRGEQVESADLVARFAIVNFTAPAAIGSVLAGRMAARGWGALVFIGSAAAFRALPFAAAYSGSKAGLARFADALRLSVRQHGVAVTLVSPGFIDTAAVRGTGPTRPFAMAPERIAERIVAAVRRKQAHLILPWPFAPLRLFDRLLPRSLRDRLLLAVTPPG